MSPVVSLPRWFKRPAPKYRAGQVFDGPDHGVAEMVHARYTPAPLGAREYRLLRRDRGRGCDLTVGTSAKSRDLTGISAERNHLSTFAGSYFSIVHRPASASLVPGHPRIGACSGDTRTGCRTDQCAGSVHQRMQPRLV
jgi:hypothetical protein